MINQLSHSLDLLNGRTCRDGIRHVFPIVSGFTEIDCQRAVFRMILWGVSIASLTMQRMVPILHQLGGSRSHASCIAVTARATFTQRAEIVVRVILVPCGLDEKHVFPTAMARNEATAFFEHSPVGGDSGLWQSSLRGHHHALTDDFQIVGQSRRHVVGIEHSPVGITDDGTIVVVGSHDDETRFADIKDIIAGLSPIRKRRLNQIQLVALTGELEIGLHEGLSQAFCGLLVDRTGLKRNTGQRQCQHNDDVLFHSKILSSLCGKYKEKGNMRACFLFVFKSFLWSHINASRRNAW